MPSHKDYSYISSDREHDVISPIDGSQPWVGDNRTLGERTGVRRICAALSLHRWILDTFLLIIILSLLVEKRWQKQTNQYEITGDLTGFAPKFGQQIMTFQPDPMFSNVSAFFTDAVKQKWLDLVPKGLGYIQVRNPEDYSNLPTPLPEYKPMTVFTTSVTHQLHCLHTIAEMYSEMSSGNMDVHDSWHISHCFDYLRQSIMCCGDTALEGAQTTFPEGFEDGSDGWDAKHVCRDYKQVYDYLEKERVNDDIWI